MSRISENMLHGPNYHNSSQNIHADDIQIKYETELALLSEESFHAPLSVNLGNLIKVLRIYIWNTGLGQIPDSSQYPNMPQIQTTQEPITDKPF